MSTRRSIPTRYSIGTGSSPRSTMTFTSDTVRFEDNDDAPNLSAEVTRINPSIVGLYIKDIHEELYGTSGNR